MASQSTVGVQVYLQIAEAKGLKGVEKGGPRKAFATISVDGKKRKAQTSKSQNLAKPSWYEEFVLTVAGRESLIEIYFWSSGLFKSHSPLGMAKLKLVDHDPNVLHDISLPLDTQGEIQVYFQITPLNNPLTVNHMTEKLPGLRILLGNNTYYPGSEIRGIVVFCVKQAKTFRSLSLELDGRSTVSWHKTKHTIASSCRSYVDWCIPLLGDPTSRNAPTMTLQPGVYVFPFEYTLPMALPPSARYIGYNAKVIYELIAKIDTCVPSSGPDHYHSIVLRILSNPETFSSLVMGDRPLMEQQIQIDAVKGGLMTKAPVSLSIAGPPIAYAGELYTVKVRLENHGAKPIESLTVYLRTEHVYHGYYIGEWVCHRDKPHLDKWLLGDLPGFPVAPGATWEGNVQCQMPARMWTSLPATFCPNIQIHYQFKIKVATTGNVFTKAQGISKFNVFIADRNLSCSHLIPPKEPQGPLNEVWISTPPHDPNWASGILKLLPPGTTHDGKSLPIWGFLPGLGRVSTLSSAIKPTMVPISNGGIRDDEWSIGRIPAWVKPEPSTIVPIASSS